MSGSFGTASSKPFSYGGGNNGFKINRETSTTVTNAFKVDHTPQNTTSSGGFGNHSSQVNTITPPTPSVTNTVPTGGFSNSVPTGGFSNTVTPYNPQTNDPYIDLLQTNNKELKQKLEQIEADNYKMSLEIGTLRERTRIVDDLSRLQHQYSVQIIVRNPDGTEKDIILPSY